MRFLFCILLACTLLSTAALGDTFTAYQSGEWTDPETWRGEVPNQMVTADQITIPAGMTVTVNDSVNLLGPTAQLTVDGTLAPGNQAVLNIYDGTLAGEGTVGVNRVRIRVPSDKSTRLPSKLVIVRELVLGSGKLDIRDSSFTVRGRLTLQEGRMLVNDNTRLKVDVVGSWVPELRVEGALGALILKTPAEVQQHLTITKLLSTPGGKLNMKGWDLTLTADSVLGATVSAGGDVIIRSRSGPTKELVCIPSTGCTTLTIDVGELNKVKIRGFLIVEKLTSIVSGVLVIDSAQLSIRGELIGAGLISGNRTSELSVDSEKGISTPLKFAPGGDTLGRLVVGVGKDVEVVLGSDIVVDSAVSIINGTLDIRDIKLITHGFVSGPGWLRINDGTNLSLGKPGGFSEKLYLKGDTIGTLTVDVGDGFVYIHEPLAIRHTLNVVSGVLSFQNSATLRLLGTCTTNPEGTISPQSVYIKSRDVVLLHFTPGDSAFYRFDVDLTGGGRAVMASDFSVDDSVIIKGGLLELGDNMLSLSTDAEIARKDKQSYVSLGSLGKVRMRNSGSSGARRLAIGTPSGYFPVRILVQPPTAAGYIETRLIDGVRSHGNSGSYLSATQPLVNASWSIKSDIIEAHNIDLTFGWGSSSEVHGFDRTRAYVSQYGSSGWDSQVASPAVADTFAGFSLPRQDVMTSGVFAVFDLKTSDIQEDGTTNTCASAVEVTADEIAIRLDRCMNLPMQCELFDLTGSVVMEFAVSQTPYIQSIRPLNYGIYFLRMHDGRRTLTKIFLKD